MPRDFGGNKMNAHLTHHDTHMFEEIIHSLSFGLHSKRVWQIIGFVAFVGIMAIIFVFAASLGGSQSSTYNFPYYPIIP